MTHISPKLYSINDACFILGNISRDQLNKLVNDGDLVKVKLGRRAFIRADSIDEFINSLSKAA